MGLYDEKILPRLINLACSSKPSMKQREKIVPHAAGDVLEIGFGSGLNVPFYDKQKVRKVFGLEPSEGMRKLAEDRISESSLDIELIDLPGEEIPLEANSVDTVLITYTLCTITDVAAALEGMRRVLKPGGKLLFSEHGRAPDKDVVRWQNRLNPAWRKIGGGCNMNRDIPAMIQEGGFRITEDERMYIPGPRIFSYTYWGSAEAD
jgi:ubiquinone/menaquinone biosynthesis C-methylase UbiE